MNGFDDPRDTDRLKQLCEALGEPYETPSEWLNEYRRNL